MSQGAVSQTELSQHRRSGSLLSGAIYLGPLAVAFLCMLLFPKPIAGFVLGGVYGLVLLASVSVGLAITAKSPTLPRLADQSILLRRLTWFARFSLAALLLLWSTYVGSRWESMQANPASAGSLLVEVVIRPVQLGIVVGMVLLAIDLARLGAARRVSLLASLGMRGGPLTLAVAVADPLWNVIGNVTAGLVIAMNIGMLFGGT